MFKELTEVKQRLENVLLFLKDRPFSEHGATVYDHAHTHAEAALRLTETVLGEALDSAMEVRRS